MFRWEEVEEVDLFDMTIKMYRDPFVEDTSFVSPMRGLELDHYAFEYLQSELFTYKIMDVNFEQYIEERGDLDELYNIIIPSSKNELETIL